MTLSGATVQARVEQLRRLIEDAGRQPELTRLSDSLAACSTQLDAIVEEARRNPEVRVLLVGTTGAGKSTLLNALLGRRVLPVSNMKACTAAIAEIGYDRNRLAATVEFVPRGAWEREKAALLADLRDLVKGQPEEESGEGSPAEAIEVPRATRDKLAAVFGINPLDVVSRLAVDAEEPEEIREAIDGGFVSFECDANKDAEFGAFLRLYLSSDKQFWPIVQRIRIRGPFEACANGAIIVDLPGINDPNEAREQVTKEQLRTCRFVWIVFRMTRSLTKDITELLETNSFLRDLVMDGRSDALTFVGTASDDFDADSLAEELGLFADASPRRLAEARNASVREEVRKQLESVWQELEKRSPHPDDLHAADRRRRFVGSRVYTVSAKESLRLAGLARYKEGPFETSDQTELPQLHRHLQESTAAFGIEVRDELLHRRLDDMIAELKQGMDAVAVAAERRLVLSDERRKELDAAVAAAETFLEERLRGVAQSLDRDLQAARNNLVEKVDRAIGRAEREVDRTCKYWSQIHFMTLRAIARRGGVFQGSKNQWDLPGEIAGPVLDSIAFDWTDFFNERLRTAISDDRGRLVQAVHEHAASLESKVRVHFERTQDRADSGTLSRSAQELLDQRITVLEHELMEFLTGVQRSLRHSIPAVVKASMQPAFDKAAAESGKGMKDRMVAVISDAAHQASQDMVSDANLRISEGITGVLKRIRSDHAEWESQTRRLAGLNAQNCRLGTDDANPATIRQHIATLRQWSARVAKEASASTARL